MAPNDDLYPEAEMYDELAGQPVLGRLRRWHDDSRWGFIFSERHNCDIFFDANNAQGEYEALAEGDFVFFESGQDELGQPVARSAWRATPEELDRHGARLAQASQDKEANAALGVEEHYRRQQGQSARLPPPPPPPAHHAIDAGANAAAFPQHSSTQGMQQGANQAGQYYYSEDGQTYLGYGGQGAGGYDQGYAQQAAVHEAPAQPKLLLEPPAMLERLNPKMVVKHLASGTRSDRRPRSVACSRAGVAMQVGKEFGQALKDVRDVCQQAPEFEASVTVWNPADYGNGWYGVDQMGNQYSHGMMQQYSSDGGWGGGA